MVGLKYSVPTWNGQMPAGWHAVKGARGLAMRKASTAQRACRRCPWAPHASSTVRPPTHATCPPKAGRFEGLDAVMRLTKDLYGTVSWQGANNTLNWWGLNRLVIKPDEAAAATLAPAPKTGTPPLLTRNSQALLLPQLTTPWPAGERRERGSACCWWLPASWLRLTAASQRPAPRCRTPCPSAPCRCLPLPRRHPHLLRLSRACQRRHHAGNHVGAALEPSAPAGGAALPEPGPGGGGGRGPERQARLAPGCGCSAGPWLLCGAGVRRKAAPHCQLVLRACSHTAAH